MVLPQIQILGFTTNKPDQSHPDFTESLTFVCLLLPRLAAETPQEASMAEEGSLEGEGWAKPLALLWQDKPANLRKEREYNQRVCSKPPYCSVCTLFHTYQQVTR